MTRVRRPVLAAGAVLWRPGDDPDSPVEVGMVHRPKYDDWSLPKGKLDHGEHLLACAVREVLEETGHAITLGAPVGVQRYPVLGVPKEVRYWAARADDAAPMWPGTLEIDALQFVAHDRLSEQLTHARDVELVDAAVVALGSPPRATSPLIVLRHAKARPRKQWRGLDGDRPLDARGIAQADRLAVLLACFGVQRVVTSDSLRCIETVRPYATAARLHLELEPRVTEEAHDEDGPEAAQLALRELFNDPRPTVLCSHRPVLPSIITALGPLPDSPFPMAPLDDDPLTPGSFVVVHRRWPASLGTADTAEPDLVGSERHDL
jgi:8-oxo-dGTP diphosphatase